MARNKEMAINMRNSWEPKLTRLHCWLDVGRKGKEGSCQLSNMWFRGHRDGRASPWDGKDRKRSKVVYGDNEPATTLGHPIGVFASAAQRRGLSGETCLGVLIILTVLSKLWACAQRECLGQEERREWRAPAVWFQSLHIQRGRTMFSYENLMRR